MDNSVRVLDLQETYVCKFCKSCSNMEKIVRILLMLRALFLHAMSCFGLFLVVPWKGGRI